MNVTADKNTFVIVPLGERIQALRAARDLGLREAARLCQIDPTKLADAEAGKDSRASTVAAIARGLQVSADYLLGLDDAAPEQTKQPAHAPLERVVDRVDDLTRVFLRVAGSQLTAEEKALLEEAPTTPPRRRRRAT